MIEGNFKNKSQKSNAPRDESTRTAGVKHRHVNEAVKENERETKKKKNKMSHLEEAEIKGLYHKR